VRSRNEAAAVVLTVALLSPLAGAAPPAGRPTDAQVRAALAQVKADPNLGTTKKTHILDWQDSEPSRPANHPSSDWLRGLVRWIGDTSRVLMWVTGGLAACMLILYLARLIQQRTGRPRSLPVPTHIRELDIRPESLPADIGAAALDLWEQGAHRAALALLYRGMLSRLVHVHAVPIRQSSTEGDCEQLAAAYLGALPMAYVSRLIRAWQDAVYGGKAPAPDTFRALCRELDPALAAPASALTREAA
jgi:hypothetical protein